MRRGVKERNPHSLQNRAREVAERLDAGIFLGEEGNGAKAGEGPPRGGGGDGEGVTLVSSTSSGRNRSGSGVGEAKKNSTRPGKGGASRKGVGGGKGKKGTADSSAGLLESDHMGSSGEQEPGITTARGLVPFSEDDIFANAQPGVLPPIEDNHNKPVVDALALFQQTHSPIQEELPRGPAGASPVPGGRADADQFALENGCQFPQLLDSPVRRDMSTGLYPIEDMGALEKINKNLQSLVPEQLWAERGIASTPRLNDLSGVGAGRRCCCFVIFPVR